MQLKTLPNFLLLAHHPEKGRFLISEMQLNYGIIGAVLLEMAADNLLQIENDCLILTENATSAAPIYTEIIELLKQSKKTRKVKYWVSRLARKARKWKWIILEALEQNGIIMIKHKMFLGLIPYRKSYLLETEPRIEIIDQLKQCVFSDNDRDESLVPLLGLVEACKLHHILSGDRKELKQIKTALKEVLKNSSIANSVDQTIKQVQAAIITSVATTAAVSAANAN